MTALKIAYFTSVNHKINIAKWMNENCKSQNKPNKYIFLNDDQGIHTCEHTHNP